MATREIKTRFKLEGEQEYKRAMSEAAGVIKTLNSEQKLAKAQYEATGDAQQYAADQARILKEQIEQQKKAVSAAEDAVKKLTDNGVDKNADSMRKWRERLNNARTALYNMQTRLNHVGDELGEEEQAFGKAQTAGSNYQNEMEKVNKGIDFQNTITAIDHITGHIETVIKTAAKGAKALWDMGVDAGTWADNIATAASQAGVDPETYQSWQYASRFIDSNVDDIVKNWRDIDNKLIAEGETGQKYLADLAKVGVASINSTTGQLRQGSDIFWDLIDYLNGIGDAEKRTAEATKFFGNDWRRLNPLIEAGSKAYKDLANEGRSVAVVSNENVAALGAVDDAVQDMGARFDKLKYDTLAELAPTFEKTARALSTAITAMDEFVQSAEGQAALAGLNEALSGIIDSFLGKDNGQGTFKAIVEGASGAVKGFTDAMNWIKDNGIVVTGIVAGMGIAWSTLKVTKEVLTFAQLLSGRGTGGGLFSKIFKGKTASAEGLDDATKSFRDAADSFSSSAESAKQAADAAKASAEAGKGAADAAKTSADAAKGSVDAAKASAEAGKAAADAGKASADAANSSAAAANSSSGAAQSASSAVGQSATAAANSATAAADSALGAAEARASLEAGAAGAQESATRAAAARIEAENAAKLANDAANRARLNSGGSGNPLSNLLGSGNGVSIRPQLKIPVGGSGSGGPTFPPMLSNPATPLLGHGAGAVATQTTLLEKVLAALSGGATKLAGGLGLGAYILLKPGKTAGNDLDQLYNDDGSLTTAGREAGLSEKVGIYFWDHNRENLVDRALAVLDEETLPMVQGAAFHWYSGDHYEAPALVHERFPRLKLMFSEGCCEYIPSGDSRELSQAVKYAHDILSCLNAGMDAWFDWNLFLDEKGGPNHVGNFCSAPIMLDGQGGYEKRAAYAYIRQISEAVRPGAVRIGFSRYTDQLDVAAFRNPDGSLVCILLNRSGEEKKVNLRLSGDVGAFSVPACAISVLNLE